MNKRPYQIIGEQLREELLKGNYKVGDRLPPERDIAERLNVSRATVRDAMIMLELEELVEVRKGSGIYVIEVPSQKPAPSAANENVFTIADNMGVFEMLQARQVIESHIAEFAASQVTKNDVVRLQEALQLEQDAIANNADNETGDKAFHMAIAEATQNSALVDIANRLWLQRQSSQPWQVLHKRLADLNYRQKWLGEHHAIFTALKRKQPEQARRAMWQHLESVKQTLLELSDVDDPAFDGYLFDSYSLQAR
ncbi:GntR family transcriptional regulator [Saccharobesus litoralis]|uniref:GntR family transcriptional regulator n=1 Tax=Saccharobesus litoralis TaxID=2172099 RepID=A0A2S0VME5_9ALTE|nr:FCD domain-containing protein [Saccharobesus litoralis]AWB65393.1 GntR family transcriptional regulator [Saccharobesus litoralis]